LPRVPRLGGARPLSGSRSLSVPYSPRTARAGPPAPHRHRHARYNGLSHCVR